VAHIVDIDPLRLELTIPEQNLSAVQKGLKVDFQVAAFPERTFSGVVHYIGPSVRATTRDLVFEALVPNKDKLLRPGLFATAHLDAGIQKLPAVPRSALKQDGDTTRAFAVVDDLPHAEGGGGSRGATKHVEERLIQLGAVQGDVAAVLKGLSAGERIVAHPSDQISDGTEVE
jgi:membrane fusion protein (multidrug efflux system)